MAYDLVILGAGESGTGAALLAKSKGLNVFVSDSGKIACDFRQELLYHKIAFEENGHTEALILQAKEIIKSPGIPDTLELIKKILDHNIPIISDIEFAGRFTKAHILGITGSNGKTTTTLWLYHILKTAGLDVELAGNVGISPCRILVNRDPSYFIMELSSFQLDGLVNFRVNTAVLTNITPDHLDRYQNNFERYIDSKLKIINGQSAYDKFIWCLDDKVIENNLSQRIIPSLQLPFSFDKNSPARISAKDLSIETGTENFSIPIAEIALKGRHNLYNAMAASLAAVSIGVKSDIIIKGLKSFKGVEHRLELVKEINGVLYINDSKATNVNSTWYALDSMTRPIIWIAGGTDKGNDYSVLLNLVSSKVKALICLGLDNTKLINTFESVVTHIKETKSMRDAVKEAEQLSKPGDVVLLSPACASFDLFENYIQRGKLYKQMIDEII